MLRINGTRLIADLRKLAEFGKCGTGVDRIALSQDDIAARRWLCDRLREIGLAPTLDRVGNVLGRASQARAVLIGSHTDTVPRGGWLDGALGVIYGLEIARAWREAGGTGEIGIDVVSFEDEEGTYLPCLGSRSFCGGVAEADIAAAKSKAGVGLPAALEPLKGEAAPLRLDPARTLAYLEAHIEQGPRLESGRRRVGIVTGIVGIRRLRIAARGQADHAGTTPMAMRKDAAAPLFRLAAKVEQEFPRIGGAETVWNIGTFNLRPGAANVVPSEAEMVVEFRDIDTAVLDRLERALLSWVEQAPGGAVELEATPIARINPAAMAADVGEAIRAAAIEHGDDPLTMPSGAGHDAMFLSPHVPSAMMFIPSIGGRSHDISEDTAEADIIFGCQVLATATETLIRRAAA